MNVRDKKRWPAPCPPFAALSLYGALAVPIVEAQGRVLAGTGQGVCRCRTESRFFQRSRSLREFCRLVLGKTKLKAVCGTI